MRELDHVVIATEDRIVDLLHNATKLICEDLVVSDTDRDKKCFHYREDLGECLHSTSSLGAPPCPRGEGPSLSWQRTPPCSWGDLASPCGPGADRRYSERSQGAVGNLGQRENSKSYSLIFQCDRLLEFIIADGKLIHFLVFIFHKLILIKIFLFLICIAFDWLIQLFLSNQCQSLYMNVKFINNFLKTYIASLSN